MSILITGGTFTQVNNFNTQSRSLQTPWDHLQAAVAPAAFHNAAERFDPPRCHPNTRVGVMGELRELALRKGDAGGVRILWLNGPAGAGKSAIAQSFCEECFSTNSLLASFFFNRSDPSRNNAKSFVATLTYQIYQKVPSSNQSLVLTVIEDDPLVFERSIDAQFTALIINPLQDLIEGDYFVNNAPFVIVVDGLDECATATVQVSILTALQNISKLPQFPFVFVITSRPEHDIQTFFRSSANVLGGSLRQLTLDNSYHPDADIALFLREKFQAVCATNPHKDSIPHRWPSSKVIGTLVSKSSGHFIYPSVVIKYVSSSRHYPPDRLDIVLGLRRPRGAHPLAELDSLYSHILSCVDNVDLVLQILRILVLFGDMDRSKDLPLGATSIEQLCNLERGECHSALCDLQSVLQIDPPGQPIRILHKSFSDYLQDSSRSHEYYINTSPEIVAHIAVKCLRVMSYPNFDYDVNINYFVERHRLLLANNIQICQEGIMSFRVDNTFSEGNDVHTFWDLEWVLHLLLDALYTLVGTEYEYVYRHQLHHFTKRAFRFFKECQVFNFDEYWPWIMIFVLSGNSKVHIPSRVFDILQSLARSASLRDSFYVAGLVMRGSENLSYAFAQHCIRSLKYDRNSRSTAFALESLPMTLPCAKLSGDLNQACYTLCSILAYSPEKPLAYNSIGQSCAQMGYTVAKMAEMTKELELSARKAMRDYVERYARGDAPYYDE